MFCLAYLLTLRRRRSHRNRCTRLRQRRSSATTRYSAACAALMETAGRTVAERVPSRLWWRATIRAAFQHSSLPSIRRARPVARPLVRARAHPRTVGLTFATVTAVESVNRVFR
jgi:hypothetical protein